MSSREAQKSEAALNTLAMMAGPDLSEMSANDPSAFPLKDAIDVTAEFLAPAEQKPQKEKSTVYVYKGIVKRLASLPSTANRKVGVLAGSAGRVFDVIMGPSVQAILGTQEVAERWKSLDFHVLGMVCWEDVPCPRRFEEQFAEFCKTACEPILILICFADPLVPCAWDVQLCDGEVFFQPVSLHQAGSGRLKNDSFLVEDASRVAVTIRDQVLTCQNA